MFTGLVRAVGELCDVREAGEGRTLTIRAPLSPADLEIGASVAVSGVCLTVIHAGLPAEGPREGELVSFQAAFETLRATTLGARTVGDRVNLEPSLRVGDPLGGHLVSGHVDGVATVLEIHPRGDAREVWVSAAEAWQRHVAPKGSITLDGVSLTVNEVRPGRFMVGLVPHTLAVTTLGSLAPGSRVNVEIDTLARYVARLFDARFEKGTP